MFITGKSKKEVFNYIVQYYSAANKIDVIIISMILLMFIKRNSIGVSIT